MQIAKRYAIFHRSGAQKDRALFIKSPCSSAAGHSVHIFAGTIGGVRLIGLFPAGSSEVTSAGLLWLGISALCWKILKIC
jgi:hypothetical protein